MQEAFKKRILVLSTHNVSLAHTPRVLNKIADSYNQILGNLSRTIEKENLREELEVDPLKPLFRVR